jgi:hypothetical protein
MRKKFLKICAGLLSTIVLWSCDTADSLKAVPISTIPGVSWRDFRVATSPDLRSMVWTGTQLVAVGEGIWTSPDGDVWQKRHDLPGTLLMSIVRGESLFVAVGQKSDSVGTSAAILTSPDGLTWTPRASSAPDLSLREVAWSGSLFLAVGGEPSGQYDFKGIIVASEDGVTWETRRSGSGGYYMHVLWTDSLFVVSGSHSSLMTSPDGTNWTGRALPQLQAVGAMIWTGSRIVAGGSSSYAELVWTSPDGITWNSTAQENRAEGLAWGDSLGVAVGYQNTGGSVVGAVMTSPDALTWTTRRLFGSTLNAVAWTGSRFVAVGNYGAVLISPP